MYQNKVEFDYSSFSQKVSLADMQHYAKWRKQTDTRHNGQQQLLVAAVFIGCAVLFCIVISLVPALVSGGREPINGSLMIFALLLVLMSLIGAATVLRDVKKRVRLFKFASSNQVPLAIAMPGSPSQGVIFSEGHTRQVKESLSLPGGIELGNYQYITGEGKNRREHNWTYVQLILPRHLPHMVLDARANNFLGKLTNLPESFARSQRLSLEGDFDEYFTLYAPAEYKTDALYIFTPDVMAMLIDKAKNFDIEIIDNKLQLYAKYLQIDHERTINMVMELAELMRHEVGGQGARYADQRIYDHSIDVIAEPGRRLKTGFAWSTIITIALVLVYMIFTIFY